MYKMLKHLQLFASAALMTLFTAVVADAANITSTQSGNWDVGTTWVGGIPPVAGDTVTVASSHTVTVAVDAAADTITIAANSSGTNGITINSGILLNVSRAIAMAAPTAGTSTIAVGAGTLQAARVTIPGSATAGRNCVVTVSTGTITTTGSITFSGTAAQAQFISTGASTVNIAGNFGSGGTLTTSGTGTINFNGGTAQTIGTYTTYNNIAINNASGGVTLTGTTTFGGTFAVSTGTLTVGAFSLTVTGATSVSSTLSITSTTGTKTFTGNVTINNGGTWNNSGNEAVSLAGSLQNDGTFTAGTGVYTFTGTTKTISGTMAVSIPNLTINSTVTNNGALVVGTALSGGGTLTNGTNSSLNLGGTFTINTIATTANPNTVTYDGAAQSILTGQTYHHLTLAGSGTKTQTSAVQITTNGDLTVSGTATMTTTQTVTVNGALTIGSTASFNCGGFDFSVTGNTTVNGTLTHSHTAGTKTFGNITVNNGGLINFTAAENIAANGNLQVDGTGTITGTQGTWTFQKSGGGGTLSGTAASTTLTTATFTTAYTNSGNYTMSGTLTVTGVTLTNNGTLTASSALSGSGGLTQGADATLNIGGTSGITTLTATANPNTVNYSGGAQTAKAITYHDLSLSGSGSKTLTNVGTINGDLALSGTCTAATAIATTIGGKLTVGSGTTLTIAGFNLTVTGNTSVSGTLAHSSATGAKTHVGAVTINSSGSWTNAGNAAFTLQGGLTHNGSTFTSGTGVYTFDINNQSVGGSSALTISNVTVTGIILTNNSTNFTASTALSGTGELLQGTSATLKIGGTSGVTTLTATANLNTVDYNGAAQTVRAIIYHHLSLSGSAAKTMPGSTLTLNGNFTMSGTCTATALAAINTAGSFTVGSTNTFSTGTFTHDIKGDFSNSGTFTATGSTITLTGTADQSIGGSTATTFNHLTVNKASGMVTASTAFNVSGTLTLTSGNISAGANTVVITSTGSVSRTSGHVVGKLQKNVATGSNVSRTFEIGSTTNYLPVDVVFATVSTSGDLTAGTTAGDHANIATSDVNPAKSVNRYWTLNVTGGLVFTDYNATFNFLSSDVDVGANTANFVVRRFSGGTWSNLTVGTRTSTSTDITGVTAVGDFQVGNILSVAVSNSVFAFGTQLLNTWLTAQSSIITNDGTETEAIVAQISTFTAGADTWTLSTVSNGADQIRAQWSTTSDTGPWNDISAYATNFAVSSGLAASGTITFYVRIQTPISTTSNNQYSSNLIVTAQ